MKKKKIALLVATPVTFNAFYHNHIAFLKQKYDVTLISNFEGETSKIEGVHIISVKLERKPSLLIDLKTLMVLVDIFKKEKFDIIHSTTPKAGLLSQLAGKLASIPVRIHIFTGQVWANKVGFKRWILKKIDTLIAMLSTHLLADSHSQKDFLVNENIPVSHKIQVLGYGSISGVNRNRFYPSDEKNKELRKKLKIPTESFVFLFIGRLNKDKGILDLLKSFESVYEQNKHSILVVVGSDEENILPIIQEHHLYSNAIFYQGFTSSPEDYMRMADILCLPSYREGFGSVIIEASACGTPSIGSNIYGLSDAIEDGKSGLLFSVGNVKDLTEKMQTCIHDKQLTKQMSEYGLQRVYDHFDQNISSTLLIQYYDSIVGD